MTILKKPLLCAVAMCMTAALWAQVGSLDPSFNPTDIGFGHGSGANGVIYATKQQADGKFVIGGQFTAYNEFNRSYIARVNEDGSHDGSFNPGTGPNFYVHAIALQSSGGLIIGGGFTQVAGVARGRIARLNSSGTLDNTYATGTGANDRVNTLAIQPDGKVLIGGNFTTVHGTSRTYLARLDANGALDPGFTATGVNGAVNSIVLQPDGKILIGGAFTLVNGTTCNRIARLGINGELDLSFTPGTGTNNAVLVMALRADGSILIGGGFTQYNGVARSRLALLAGNGTLVNGFVGPSLSNNVESIAVLSDDRYMVGGGFGTWPANSGYRVLRLLPNGAVDNTFQLRHYSSSVLTLTPLPTGSLLVGALMSNGGFVRLLNDGSYDPTFNPGTGASAWVRAVAVQSDGRPLIGGQFIRFDNVTRNRIARLNSDGSVDTGFDPGAGPDSDVFSMAVQTDGKILIGGTFNTYQGISRNHIARLNANGSLDMSFDPGTGLGGPFLNTVVEAIIIQPDGKILIAGGFTSVAGVLRNGIARLHANGTLDTSFDPGSGSSNGHARTIALQSDGKVLVGGSFSSFAGSIRSCMARLLTNGSLDAGFTTGTGFTGDPAMVSNIAPLSNGTILIGGSFTAYNGTLITGSARLLGSGALDPGFFPAAIASFTGLIEPDGKLIARTNTSFYRLDPDGSLDASFSTGTGANGSITHAAFDLEGRILFGGQFTAYNGIGRNRVARLNTGATLGLRMMLEGPFNGGQMSDALRTLPTFPLTEPFTDMGYSNPAYTPGATMAPSVLATTGNNAIVDWVVAEMRPIAAPGTVAASRAVLLQRDGDVVDLDGVNTVGFAGLAAGNYCVALRSRNHLPVMSSPTTPVNYGNGTATFDFTLPTSLVYDNDARQNVGGTMLLAAGDVTFSGTVQYTGTGNDRDPVLSRIGGVVPTNIISGYWREDVNMDGTVKYAGSGNDRDVILRSIGGVIPTSTRIASLP